jgi:hypothetical protein
MTSKELERSIMKVWSRNKSRDLIHYAEETEKEELLSYEHFTFLNLCAHLDSY